MLHASEVVCLSSVYTQELLVYSSAASHNISKWFLEGWYKFGWLLFVCIHLCLKCICCSACGAGFDKMEFNYITILHYINNYQAGWMFYMCILYCLQSFVLSYVYICFTYVLAHTCIANPQIHFPEFCNNNAMRYFMDSIVPNISFYVIYK